MKLKRGSTSIRRLIFVGDSSSTTGAGLANLLHNTSGLVAYYFAGDLSNEVSIPLASATLGSYTDGGFVAVDNTNMPGWYEFGIPNGALDGGNEVAIQLRGAANMVPVNVYIELDTVDYQTDAFGAIKPTTAGRTLDISAGGEAGIDLSNVGSPTTVLNLSGTTIKTATDIETDTQDIQNRLPSGLVDGRMRSIAEVVGDKLSYKLASDGLSLVTSWAVGITGNITGNLSGSVGSVTGNVGGNVTGSVGSISGVAFPTNFAALGINSSGHVSRVVLVDTTTTNTDMRGTDGAALATHWTSTRAGYLDGVLLAANFSNRTVQVTGVGSGHIAADVHSLQPAVINNTHFAPGAFDANALAADAVTEIQNGLALEASSQSILARIGAFTGTGVNTILGFFRALLRSDGGITTPSDVGGTFTHTTDSTQAIRDRGDAAWTTGGGGGGSTTVNVLPYTGAVPDRVEGTTIKVFYNELTNVSVGVTDATGAAVTLDAKTLRFCVEDRYGVDVLTLTDGDITRSGSTFTVQIPQSLTDTVGANYRWSLRDLTGSLNTVLIHGQLIVAEAAEDEA